MSRLTLSIPREICVFVNRYQGISWTGVHAEYPNAASGPWNSGELIIDGISWTAWTETFCVSYRSTFIGRTVSLDDTCTSSVNIWINVFANQSGKFHERLLQ